MSEKDVEGQTEEDGNTRQRYTLDGNHDNLQKREHTSIRNLQGTVSDDQGDLEVAAFRHNKSQIWAGHTARGTRLTPISL